MLPSQKFLALFLIYSLSLVDLQQRPVLVAMAQPTVGIRDHAFRRHVDETLKYEGHGFEVSRTYGVTPLGQRFAFIVTKVAWYAVRLITESDRSNLNAASIVPLKEQMYSFRIVERHEFLRQLAADIYVRRRCAELEKGNYGKVYPTRFLAPPPDCVKNPAKYLKRGDHLRRYVLSGIGFHDGIYLGDGRVAHLSNGVSNNFSAKREASARIDSLSNFASNKSLYVVEHCIRRRRPSEIAEEAEEHCRVKLWHGEYDLSQQNCQHFAYMCAAGCERMSPANLALAKVANAMSLF
uniref:LRAT domain-containing protein n=1 Tax=Panagrellus redivivus TaxID=6233 RepID=A0A7E4VUI8_PANRE